jgi:hypothetical protein
MSFIPWVNVFSPTYLLSLPSVLSILSVATFSVAILCLILLVTSLCRSDIMELKLKGLRGLSILIVGTLGFTFAFIGSMLVMISLSSGDLSSTLGRFPAMPAAADIWDFVYQRPFFVHAAFIVLRWGWGYFRAQQRVFRGRCDPGITVGGLCVATFVWSWLGKVEEKLLKILGFNAWDWCQVVQGGD